MKGKKKLNFWCRNGIHKWIKFIAVSIGFNDWRIDLENEWRQCKRDDCRKKQSRYSIYDKWEDK